MEIEFERVSKSYGRGAARRAAVDSVSWSASSGEIFGIVGPNGAGKTTMIRMLLDIIRPDAGEIRIDGSTVINRTRTFRSRVGYLPEERGLYKQERLLNHLLYLARLKGVGRRSARRAAEDLLQRFGLEEYGRAKIAALSKGMAQKAQLIGSLIHQPEVVVFDEPFAGLDPVNLQLVRELIREQRGCGRLVLLLTHMMREVETLCDRIFMINRGRRVLYGPVEQIRREHSPYDLIVNCEAAVEKFESVASAASQAGEQRVTFAPGCVQADFMCEAAAAGVEFRYLSEGLASIEDIFVSVVEQSDD